LAARESVLRNVFAQREVREIHLAGGILVEIIWIVSGSEKSEGETRSGV
jgi:hypothetical protein